MAPKSTRPGKAEFSIDEFFAEIEKAEDIAANKPLYAERMRNKSRMDWEQAEAARKQDAEARAAAKEAEKAEKAAQRKLTALEKRRTTKSSHDTVTGMSARTSKTKINSVDRIDFDGMGEAPQAGFGHKPS